MRLLVTGGAGFNGANLTRAALMDPAVTDVRVIDDLSTGSTANLAGLDVEVVEGSILDEPTLDRALTGRDTNVYGPGQRHDAQATVRAGQPVR